MSESSADKSTRNIVSAMEQYEWVQQVSIFYLNYEDRFLAPEHKPKITRRLRRMFPDQAFLYRLRLNKDVNACYVHGYQGDSKSVSMAYHSFFTNRFLTRKELLAFVISLEKLFDCELRHLARAQEPLRRYLWINTIKREKVDDLITYFPGLKAQRRWSIVNKSKATPRTLR